MTRNGKIARLPNAVQDELNRRLDGHELGQPLLDWLNGLPDVQRTLATLFGGRAINKQNLSEWRQGGFREWQNRQEALKHIPDILAQTAGLQPSAAEPITDKLAPWLAVQYFMMAEALLKTGDGANKFKLLRSFCADVAALRRGDHRLAQMKLDHERLEFKHEKRGSL
jgi:hypothetical protein